MTKEGRKTRDDSLYERQQKIKKDCQEMKVMYDTLSYRKKLLVHIVMQFLIDNPEEGK